MGIYNDIGDTIEGAATDVVTRKFLKKGLKKHPITQETMMLYSCDLNSKAKITSIINEPSDPEIKKKTSHFHRENGDTISAKSISVYVDFSHKSIKADVQEGISGRHGANLFSTNKHTIATIKTPLQNLLKKLGHTSMLKIE